MPRHRIPTTSAAHCEARWDATSPTGKLAVSQREPARAGFGSLRDGHRPGHECRCGRRLATTQLSGMVGRRSPAGGTLDGSDRSKARGCPTFQVRCSRNGDRRSRHGSSYARQGQDSCAGTAALSGPQESTRHRLSGGPPPLGSAPTNVPFEVPGPKRACTTAYLCRVGALPRWAKLPRIKSADHAARSRRGLWADGSARTKSRSWQGLDARGAVTKNTEGRHGGAWLADAPDCAPGARRGAVPAGWCDEAAVWQRCEQLWPKG